MAQNDGPELLRSWMRKHGMSQGAMAKATGLKQPSFSRFLRGNGQKRFNVASARIIAGMTGIPVEKLMSDVVASSSERTFNTSGPKVA